MKILATSDTHFYTDYSSLERADVFIHAGDFMMGGRVDEWQGRVKSFATVKADRAYAIPGNHDGWVEKFPAMCQRDLLDQSCVDLILPDSPLRTLPNGMTMFTIPFVVNLPDWSFNRMEREIAEYIHGWVDDAVPDIVVSHSPPFYILDRCADGSHVGSSAMLRWWKKLEKKPKLWICGHIHEGYGKIEKEGTLFANVSMCDEHYKQVNAPMVFEI